MSNFNIGDPVKTDLNSEGIIESTTENGYMVRTKYGIFEFKHDQLKERKVDNREILHG